MSNYLITGGTGFIGSHLVDKLVGAGETVHVVDKLPSGKWCNLEQYPAGSIEFVEADLSDPGIAIEAVPGVDYVLDMAAIPSVFDFVFGAGWWVRRLFRGEER